MDQNISFTKRLAPEDILPGMFIAIAARIREIPPQMPCEGIPLFTPEVVRYTCVGCADGDPRRVLANCIPFVMTEDAQGQVETFDIRQHILVQVDEMYALELFTRPGPKCSCD